MVVAATQFSEEYGADRKSLGPKCKIFLQKLWNTSAWMKVTSTEMLVTSIKDQMETKGQIKNGVLQMRISFGRAKAGQAFLTELDRHNYVYQDFGESIKFSQSGEVASPYIRKVGKVKRDVCWDKPARIAELVSELYTNVTSKMYYGFLKEHGNSLYRIISVNLSVKKDNSIFLPALDDPGNNELRDEIINRDILLIFIRSHQNDLTGAPMPETKKIPPVNETMMIMPPTFGEW